MSNTSFSENVPNINNEKPSLPSQKLNIPLQDIDNQNSPTSYQSRMLPPRNNTEFSQSPVQNNSFALSPIPHQEAQRRRSLLRESSKTPSRHRPFSGLSGETRWGSKKRGANRSDLTSQNQSIGRPDDTSAETDSYSYSGLHNIHQFYQDMGENGSRILGAGYGSPFKNKRKSLASKVKSTYYNLLRKRFKRRNSHVAPDTQEFDDQIERIKKNIHIPNNERLADLKLEEMSRLEYVEKYRDDFPLLEERKSLMRFLCRMSIISNNIISHPIFDAFIILVIIVNSIFLALDDPTSSEDTLSRVDNYFLGIYTAEMMLKIFGMGFVFPRQSYLRDPWNVLDFAIVVTSYLTIALSSVELNLRALRSLRVLRPLRTISNIDNLRIIILTVLAALKPLVETFFILFFFMLIFAIAGLQLFSGSLKKRCFALDSGIALYDPDTDDNLRFCSSDDSCGIVDGVDYICGKMIANPFNGYMNFDNIGSALLSTFVIVTMEGWSTLMKAVQMTFSPLVAIYFIALVLCGGFVLMNLTLGVIKAEFTAHSNESIQARRVKKLTYDERLTRKLDENKLDVINLIHKYNAREIHYKKYQFKKDQLIAVENSRRRRNTLIPRRRNAITPTGQDQKMLSELKNLFSNKKDSLNSNTRTDVPQVEKDTFPYKGKISNSKIVPYDSEAENLVTTTKISTPLSHRFKGFFMRPNNKNQTTEASSSVSSIQEYQFTLRDPSESNNINSPDDGTQLEQQPNTPVYQIKITEANTPEKQPNEDLGSSPQPRRSSVPSVIDEEEEEEFSADISSSKTFEGSPISRKSLLPPWLSQGKRMQKKVVSNPIRPIKSEKVFVEGNKVELINIAGIRAQENIQESLLLEEQVDDLMDDDQWFLESLKAQEVKETPIGNRDKQRAALIKKINKIKGLSESERRNLIRSVKEVDNSVIGSQDFDGNLSRNSQSRKGTIRNNSSKGPLFDSDLVERKKDTRRTLNRQGSSLRSVQKRAMKKKENDVIKEENDEEEEGIGAKRNAVVEVKVEDAIISEEDVIELQEQEKHMVLDLRRLKTEPIYGREYDSYSLNDVLPSKKENEKKRQEQEDQRRLRENKMKIVHQVTRKEEEAALERNRQKKEEYTALAMRVNEKAKEVRKQLNEEKAFDAEIHAALSIMKSKNNGTKGSSGSGAKKSASRRSSVKIPLSEHLSTHGGTQKSHLKKIRGEEKEEEELTKEQMKDFFFLLAKIQTPYENEREHEESEEYQKRVKVFDFESDYTKTRRKDLEETKITQNNWSGNIVLNSTYNEFHADKTKKALNLQDWDIWRPGVMGVIHGLRRKAKALTYTGIFNGVIMMSVFLNTLILCCNGLVHSTSVNTVFNQFNTAFTIIFAVEMAIKIFGYGVTNYARDPFNLCDAAIVVLSIVETVTNSEKNSASTAFRALRLFRTLRVLRVTKLLRALSFMKILLGVIVRSLKRCVYILILLLLLIFIYTCLGMQIFGGQLDFADNVGPDRIRQNFDTFIGAFMAVFQVNSVENWNDILEITYRSSVSKIITISYLVSWIFIGNYLFLNLFLALLLDEFTGEEVEEELDELEEEEPPINKHSSTSTRTRTRTLSKDHSIFKSASSLNSQTFSLAEFADEFFAGEDEVREMYKALPCARSLYLFPKENQTRRFCFKISKHRNFEYGILFVIVLNFFKLILDTYIPNDATTLIKISDIFNYIFVIIFLIEALIRIFSLGLVFDKGTYLRDWWNFIDFVVLVASIIDIFLSTNLSFFRAFRLLRALRPLRFISHNQNMRIIVNALFESMGPILNVLIVVTIIWLMFAILAVNLVGGQFGRCSNLPSDQLYYGISKQQCEEGGYEWKDFNANFNNVFQGILSLFIISTQEDWPDIMFWMSDANSSDVGPIENKNRTFANLYFVFFIFIGMYFLVNLFTGVIFLNYERAQKREEFRHKFLTPDQRKWVAVQSLVLFTKPDITIVEPTAKWMKPFFKLIIHDNFEYFMMGSIVVNILTMGLNYDGSPQSYRDALTYVNYLFTAIFALEMIIKHLALGFKKYWSSRWNKFDAFVVMASLVEIVVSSLNTSVLSFLRAGPQIVRIFRVLRVSRLFKLIKRFTGLRKLINTLIFSLPALFNVAALLFLVYSIFAIIATFIFKDVALGDVIDEKLNFHNFLNSFIAVFRGSTGEDWWYIMFDTIYPARCVDGTSSCATNIAGAMVFWVIMILVVQFIFLNLFVLIVIQQFEEYHLDPNNPVNKFHEKLRLEFNPTWQILSARHGGHQIHEKQLTLFFMSLSAPLGFRSVEMTRKEIALEITSMYLTTNSEGMVFYNDVLYACMKRVYGNEDLVGVPKYLVKQEVKVRKKLDQLKKKMVSKKSLSRMTTNSSSSSDYGNPVNPISEILFLGMTMKAWLNYSKRVGEKMKAAQENGFDYISSESEESEEFEESEESRESWSSSQEEQILEEQENVEEAESKDFGSDDEGVQKHSSSRINLLESRLSPQSRDNYKGIPSPGDQEDPLKNAEANFGGRTPNDLLSPSKSERINASDFKGEEGKIGTVKSLVDFWDAEKLSNISPASRNDLGTFDFQENTSNLFGASKIPMKEVLDSNSMALSTLSPHIKMTHSREQATEMYEKAEKDQLSLPLSLRRNKKGDNTTPKSGTSGEKSSSS